MKLLRKSLFSTTLALGLATGFVGLQMLALHAPVYATEKAMAAHGEFDNLCVMGLAEGKRIKTDCSVNTVFDGKTYCFRTEDNGMDAHFLRRHQSAKVEFLQTT